MKGCKVLICLLVSGIFALASGCSYCGGPASEEAERDGIQSFDELKTGLKDTRWEGRLDAVQQIKSREDIPTDQKIEALSEGLKNEVSIADRKRADGSYLSATELVRAQMTRSLGELGTDDLEALRESVNMASGETRDRLVLALGHAGDQDVAPEILKLLAGSQEPTVRMEAARVLGLLGYREAIDALEGALKDPHEVSAHGHLGPYTIFPVREQAAGALKRLGVRIIRNEQGDLEREGQDE